MSDIIDYLLDPANQKTLAFLGGGLAIAAGGAWKVITHLTTPPNIRAQDGIAAQGDVLVEDGVTIRKSTPKGPLILIGVGLLALAIGVALPRPCATEAEITDSLVACGDINARDITVGTGQ